MWIHFEKDLHVLAGGSVALKTTFRCLISANKEERLRETSRNLGSAMIV